MDKLLQTLRHTTVSQCQGLMWFVYATIKIMHKASVKLCQQCC